jgi:ABC-type Fe3+/spermidine/putrescine transport system ATPase subunit
VRLSGAKACFAIIRRAILQFPENFFDFAGRNVNDRIRRTGNRHAMMELSGLGKSYGGAPAVAGLSLRVEDDEYLTLLGPSGAGKSTLLRLIAGLDRPDAGRVLLDGEDITARPTHLRGLGFVQQKYALFPHMSVRDNVAFGLRNRAVAPVTDEGEVRRRVEAMLALVGLGDLGDRMTGQISGGQKQRVSLARTLITEPKVCLLDEPLGALDANLRERMMVELRGIRERLGVTFLHVTGSEAEALAMGDRMIVLDEGRAIQIAPPDTIYHNPATVRVARFVNAYNILPGRTEGGAFRSAGAALPLPPGVRGAAFCVIRHDMPEIGAPDAPPADGRAAIEAAFIASEFMGSRVVYFFRLPDGAVFEVERHLSRADPVEYRIGETRRLSWRADDAMFYDADGRRVVAALAQGAA